MTEDISKGSKEYGRMPVKKTSMGSLISWNVSKALETNPNIDLRAAMKLAQERLENSSSDISAVLTRHPHERHLACALLAWQNLGHRGADSLYSFVTSNRIETSSIRKAIIKSKSGCHDCPSFFGGLGTSNFMANKVYDSASVESGAPVGPVVRLPVQSIVMPVHQCHYDNKMPPARQQPRKNANDVKSKIDAACCLNTECADKLSAMESAVNELRTRASRLAQREAQRVELLERAEQAWRDLDAGYQRRLRLAGEKEHEIADQTAKLMLQRNEHKSQTNALMEELKAKTNAAEKERDALAAVEKDLCARACERAKLAEQAAKTDAALAEHLCKAAQLDRELMFKEEQSRRKQMSLEGAADSAQALVHEAERAMREELAAMRDQIGRVGGECNSEDTITADLCRELDNLRQERNDLSEDLEGCQLLCDSNMKGLQDELVNKRQQLAELHTKVMECRCKLPVDAAVMVKRTPSLAALCRCTPEDQFGGSCSCTSLRSQLLSNLLGDLFGGLQSELGDTGAQMPCQLLKCLEDKHNWDRVTPVKTNLRDYFSKLLLGELDIAIATSIEKYHATWVGASCADKPMKAAMPCESMHSEDWQARALESKAQKMATKLAEQLFKEKAKELAEQAQAVLTKQGRPPCECHPSSCCPSPPKKIQYAQCDCASGRGCAPRGAAVYQCLVKPQSIGALDLAKTEMGPPKYLQRTLQDVSQLRFQLEELKKNIIKREDLTTMEANIAKMVQFASVISPITYLLEVRESTGTMTKDPKYPRPFKTDVFTRNNGISKSINRKKPLEPAASTIKPIIRPVFGQFRTKASGKDFKRPTQQFAINMCLCDAKTKVSTHAKAFQQSKTGSKSSCKQSLSRDKESHLSSKNQAQHITSVTPEISCFDKASTLSSCTEKCICFHKKPSDISINKLLETLTKWRDDLVDLPEKQFMVKKPENPKSIFQISEQIVNSIPEKPQIKIMDDKSIGNVELFKVSSKTVKALCDSETLTDTVEQVEPSAKTKVVVELPPLTESEYMGAINLEKSTEHSCECENNQNDGATCYKNSDKFRFKCINSKKCICKSCVSTPIHHEEEPDLKSVQKSVSIHDYNTYSVTDTRTKENNNNEFGDVAVNAKTSLKSAICSALFQNDKENSIKCLGVTLSNVNSQSFLRNLNLTQSMFRDNINSCETRSVHNLDGAIQEPNANKNTERREYPVRKNCLGVDKMIEVENFKNCDESMDEPCICCPTFGADNSTDLEVNAFQLLEEHLKGKFNEFKQSVCKSSCIPSSDEEKLFTDILQGVKRIISDSTNTINCDCEGNDQVEGSWNRAYSLLYEYLKTKIERVKCRCQTKNPMKFNAVLPNLLNSISYLIENDFKRLQEICKCKKYKPSNKTELNANGRGMEIVNIDMNGCNTEVVPNVFDVKNDSTFEINDKSRSPQKDIVEPENPSPLIHNISAQVSPYHSMETKSCDAMEKTNIYAEVQTLEDNVLIVTKEGYNNPKSTTDNCNKTENISKSSKLDLDDFLKINDKPMVDPPLLQKDTDLCHIGIISNLSNKESAIQMEIERLFREQDMDIVNKKARNASLSYIGYTMNCCCDTSLGCVCTKSTVRAHNDRLKIKDIWKTNTKNNAVFRNASYMLDSAPDKLPKTVNYLEIREGFYPKFSHKFESIHRAKSNVCESEINADNEKDIILKKSKESVGMSHVTTNTISQKRKPKSVSLIDCSDYLTTTSTRKPERFNILKQNKNHEVFYPEESFLRFDNSSDAAVVNTSTTNCDCKMVPICHVKMLVENIEDKLANAQCTCDSLSSKVCPVHSQREIY